MARNNFQEVLLEAVDKGLSSLGDSPKQAIYFHLDKSFNIKKQDIPERIEAFQEAIESIFGAGAGFLEIIIMKQLYEKIGGILNWNESEKLAFSEYVTEAKRVFQKKEKTKTSTDVVVCEEDKIEV